MIGELAAVSSALLWALASVVYARMGRQVSPLALNLGKGLVAIALLILTLALQRQATQTLPTFSLGLLLISGVVGIGFGDTVYLEALRYLGARRTLLLGTLAPPMTAFLALLWLQETLPLMAWLGIALTIVGVVWVISERAPVPFDVPQNLCRGVGLALLAGVAQAGGAVLSRAALADTGVSPLWGAFLRLCAGIIVLVVWGLARRRLLAWMQELSAQSILIPLCFASFGGTYLGIWLQQVGLKYTAAGIAQTLGATSPLFVLPIAAALGETISVRAILGALLAVSGVAVLFVL